MAEGSRPSFPHPPIDPGEGLVPPIIHRSLLPGDFFESGVNHLEGEASRVFKTDVGGEFMIGQLVPLSPQGVETLPVLVRKVKVGS